MNQEVLTNQNIIGRYNNCYAGLSSFYAETFAGIGISETNKEQQILYNLEEVADLNIDIKELVSEISSGLNYFLSDCTISISPQTVPEDRQALVFKSGDVTLKYLSYGSESISFLLEIKGGKYVLKTNQNIVFYPRGSNEYPLRKNYNFDMIARRFLSLNYSELLIKNGITINPILISSANFSVEEYVEGDQCATVDFFEDEFRRNVYLILREIEMVDDNWLWKNLEPDINKEGFIRREDGIKVWIDPFVRYREVRKWLYE